MVGVRPSTIRDWARRGLIRRAGGTTRRPLWNAWDVRMAAQAEKPRRAGPPAGV